jgi:hypothetical protein
MRACEIRDFARETTEASAGIEPAMRVLQTLALPLGDDAGDFDFTGLARRVHAYARDAADR